MEIIKMKTFELNPMNGRKSFYGKAKVIERDNGDIELQSYITYLPTEVGEVYD